MTARLSFAEAAEEGSPMHHASNHEHTCRKMNSAASVMYDQSCDSWYMVIRFTDDYNFGTNVEMQLSDVEFCPFCAANLTEEMAQAEAEAETEAKRRADLWADGHARFVPIKKDEEEH